MIREFWVKNFLSIKDKQGLSFVTKGPASELVAEAEEGVFLYKLGVLYGANASGKSNMLTALNEVFSILISPKSYPSDLIDDCVPFALTKDDPTEMFVSFYANGIRFDYDVLLSRKHIIKETLFYFPNNFKSLFYEREFVGEDVQAVIKFGPSLKLLSKTQERIRENTLNNHSVLSVCGKKAFKEDIESFKHLYNWIMDYYHDVDGDNSNNKGVVDILKDAYTDEKKHRFFNQMLLKADLNIQEFRPTLMDNIIPKEVRDKIESAPFPASMKEELLRPTFESISFTNRSESGIFDIPLEYQSNGTIKLIMILNALYDMVTEDHVYYLDELGEDLHYDLLFYYLNVFLFNSKKSQLIITSQETALLSQDMINENRGVVWFVEKNRDTASSEYSRGDSFGLHKNLSLYNSYKVGRLGAKPLLGSFFINSVDCNGKS